MDTMNFGKKIGQNPTTLGKTLEEKFSLRRVKIRIFSNPLKTSLYFKPSPTKFHKIEQ